MPLDPQDKPVINTLYPLNNPVLCLCIDDKPLAHFLYGLMMGTVNVHNFTPQNGMKLCAGRNHYRMVWFRFGGLLLVARHPRDLALYILVEAPSTCHGYQLFSATDAQKGHIRLQCDLCDRYFEPRPLFVELSYLVYRPFSIESRVYIKTSACYENAVNPSNKFFKCLPAGAVRQHQGYPPCLLNSPDIVHTDKICRTPECVFAFMKIRGNTDKGLHVIIPFSTPCRSCAQCVDPSLRLELH